MYFNFCFQNFGKKVLTSHLGRNFGIVSGCLGHFHLPLRAKNGKFGLLAEGSVGWTPFCPDPEHFFFSKILGKGPDLKFWSKFRDFLSWCLGHFYLPLGTENGMFGLLAQGSVGLTPFCPDPEQKKKTRQLGQCRCPKPLVRFGNFYVANPKLFRLRKHN